MTRVLIYLSFLSLPGAEELGLLNVTRAYLVLVLIDPFVQSVLKRRSLPKGEGSQSSFLYLWLLVLVLPINFLVSQLNQVDPVVWASRAVHLALIPFFYLSFKMSRVDPETILKDISIVGFIEVALIYVSFIMYFNPSELRRAADIEMVIVYSVFILFAGYYSLKKYEMDGARRYLVLYIMVLLASILTGTRMLILAVSILTLTFQRKSNSIKGAIWVGIVVLSLSASVLFERFNLDEFENLVTVQAKIEEVEILAEYFLNNPMLGTGLGKPYQISLANAEYTYSHNILMFYLGYAGILGFFVALYPIIKLFWHPRYRIIVISIVIYYTTSTTYTNVKHSILLAFILLLLDHQRSLVTGNSSASQLVPSV